MKHAALLMVLLVAAPAAAKGTLTVSDPAFIGALNAMPPGVVITSPNSGNATDQAKSTVTVSGTTSGTPDGVTWKIGAGSTTPCTNNTGAGTFSCSVTGLTANSSNTITITASKAAFVDGTDTQAITYWDPCGGTQPLVFYRVQSEGLSNGAAIASLTNLGSLASANVTQTGSSAKPTVVANCINSKACASFDGGDVLMSSSGITSQAQPYTVGVVAGENATGSAAGVFADVTSGGGPEVLISAGGTWQGAATSFINGTAASAGKFDVVAFLANGATSNVTKNGSTASNANAGSTAFTDVRIGARSAAASFLTGRVAAVAVCAGSTAAAFKTYADADFGSTWPYTW